MEHVQTDAVRAFDEVLVAVGEQITRIRASAA